MADHQPRLLVSLLMLLALATLWGASYSFIKVGVATIPPVTLIAARTLIAGRACDRLSAVRSISFSPSASMTSSIARQTARFSARPIVFPSSNSEPSSKSREGGLSSLPVPPPRIERTFLTMLDNASLVWR